MTKSEGGNNFVFRRVVNIALPSINISDDFLSIFWILEDDKCKSWRISATVKTRRSITYSVQWIYTYIDI